MFPPMFFVIGFILTTWLPNGLECCVPDLPGFPNGLECCVPDLPGFPNGLDCCVPDLPGFPNGLSTFCAFDNTLYIVHYIADLKRSPDRAFHWYTMNDKNYGTWTLPRLKAELQKRNAKVTGKKAVLVQRLEDYDKIFGPLVTNQESVYKISVPDPHKFRDVTSSSEMPAMSEDDLTVFTQLAEREDIITSQNMYEEYFLLSCRLAVEDGDNFITGMVASEMRKNITYNVTVKDVKVNHVILEAQCECSAGMGPYAQCKHILVLLFGVIDMSNKKTIKLKPSITSSLQTFHQPQTLHSGDPIKTENLTLKFKDDNYKQLSTFDPRPSVESPTRYSYNFKNAVANYCGQNLQAKAMPIAQILKPGDKPSIFRDHDYLKDTKEEEFLQSLRLSDEERSTLEQKTRLSKKLWKRERLMRMHSSNFGQICKSTTGKKNIAKSLVKNMDVLTTAMKHGIKFEDKAIQEFEEITQINTQKCGIIVHKDHQFLASTPDRLIGENCVLEVKCPYTVRNKTISPENVPYLYLCEKTGELKLNEKHDYYYQVQGQMMCTERETAYFIIYSISDLKIIMIPRNDSFIEEMLEKLKCFYEEYFKNELIHRYLYNKKH